MSDQVRPRLADALAEVFDVEYLKEVASQVKESTKGFGTEVELECRSCGTKNRKRVIVQVPDYPRIVSALKDLVEQVEGRPGSAEAPEAGLTLVVERSWPEAVAQ